MNQLKEWLDAWLAWFKELKRSAQLVVLGVPLALLALALYVFTANPSANAVLYSSLSQDDAGQMVDRLRALKVPYRLDESGTTIRVPQDQVHELRLTLANEGLPKGGGVGFEIFDQQRFGESEFSEQVNYHRALEGELSRTISHIAGIESARVHLVLPQRQLFTSDEQSASASIAIRQRGGQRLHKEQVRGIVHLVASSVRGLSPENVTIVDDQGRRLSAGESEEELASESLAFRTEVERNRERGIQELLDTTLGPGRTVVRVSADVNFSREERTEERFDPEKVAARSYQISEERNSGATPTTAGIPGAASNLPGGEAPTSGSSLQGATRRSETRNFEVSKVVQRSVEPVGRVMGLKVAVVVDERLTAVPVAAGAAAAEKRTKKRAKNVDLGQLAQATLPTVEELRTKVQSIVESAAGVDLDRGDEVTVEVVRFPEPVPVEGPALLDQVREWIPSPNAAYVLAGLGLLTLYGLFGAAKRPRKKLKATRLDLSEGGEGAGAVAGALGAGSEAQASQARMLASDLAGRDPDSAARVVTEWLHSTEAR